MTVPVYKSFLPTPDVAKWNTTAFRTEYKLLTDNQTGAPMGLVSQNANGPQGIWALTPLSRAQIEAPSAEMLADLGATFQLNEAPYTRFQSDGIQLIPLGGEGGGTIIPPGQNWIMFSPLQVTEAGGPLIIQGGLRVIA